jgi:hypothetical protein
MQWTIFAFGLLGDETTDMFKWVFDTFLKCMGGVAPRCILTGMYTKIQFVLVKDRYGEPEREGVNGSR